MPVCVCRCPHSAPVHLHVWTPFPQCSRVKHKREIWHFQESLLQAAALDLFPQTALFWKNHCIVIFYYPYDPLEVPQLPFLWHFALLLFLPPVQRLATLARRPLLPRSTCFPPHLSLSPLSSYTQHKPLTRSARRLPLSLPPSPVIHLLPAVFHAEEDSCLNVYAKSYFLFL